MLPLLAVMTGWTLGGFALAAVPMWICSVALMRYAISLKAKQR
jgi:hypothetical protein